MPVLFVSDLHLEGARPEIGAQFTQFIDAEATNADALYILGDLFESWVGDDDPDPHYERIKGAIRSLADGGVPVYFMHGNRDFMIGQRFLDENGVMLLQDPTTIELHGQRVLLSHGDAMCTDDVEYQKARTMTRDPAWQAAILSKPLEERLAFAARAREASRAHGASVSEDIMDVNAGAVADAFRESGVDVMVHGHTHRPAVHTLEVDGRQVTRIVLGDWYEQGSVLRWGEGGPKLQSLPR